MAHLCVELVVAEVQRRVNWFERLEIYVHFLFFPILCQDGASIHHQAILWHLQVSSGCCTWQQNTHTHKRRSKMMFAACTLVFASMMLHVSRARCVQMLDPTSLEDSC